MISQFETVASPQVRCDLDFKPEYHTSKGQSAELKSQLGDCHEVHFARLVWSPEVQARLREHVICRGLFFSELGSVRDYRGDLVAAEHGVDQHVLLVCQGGAMRLDLQDQKVEVVSGQAMLIPARTVFTNATSGRRPSSLSWMCFAGEDSDYFVRNLGEGLALISLDRSAAQMSAALFRQLHDLLQEDATEMRLIHSCSLARLLLSHLLSQDKRCLRFDGEPRHPGIESALTFMQNHLNLPLALDEIARQAGLSVSHFCALFRNQMGVTPMEYFIRLKIQKARRLLVNSALTVQEIAQQVGYDDRYYFSRLFRKLHGVPPVDYRRSQRAAV